MTNIRNLKSINYNHYTPFFLNKKELMKIIEKKYSVFFPNLII